MNNQVKLIEKDAFVNFLKAEINVWSGSEYARGRADSLRWIIDHIENNNSRVGLIDTPPVPTNIEYEFEFGEQLKEFDYDLKLSPIPTIKPGDRVRHKEKEMKNGMVILVSQNGEYADVSWTGISSVTYPVTDLEVMK